MKLSSVATLPTRYGDFKIQAVEGEKGQDHIVVYRGDLRGGEAVPVRVHSECLTSEVMGSLKCDCREQLDAALRYISERDRGAVIYLRQEGRGIGLFNKIEAYALQDRGLNTIEANLHLGLEVDARSYDIAVEIIRHFEIRSVELLTNNPLKQEAMVNAGVSVTQRVPVRIKPNPKNVDYLEIKRVKMNHSL